MNIVILVLGLVVVTHGMSAEDEGSDCFVKWVHGYRLATGRPQKLLHSVNLETCKRECASTVGCAAFAFGKTSNSSTICELAINSRMRTKSFKPPSRFLHGRSLKTNSTNTNSSTSTTTTSAPPTISIDDLDRSPTYDVYIENPNANEPCFKRDALYEDQSRYGSGNGIGGFRERDRYGSAQSNNGVPIDCFYRLMSGKRLIKTHTLRAISVNSLQECQEACIAERSFNCRSISYRYMPSSGYSYPVSNCEMSSYYMQSGTISNSYSKLDFVEDYDYDYFQRETHCKTTGSTTLGVCAVVVRRGGRVSTTLIKSSHHTVTSSQCEHLCATSLFRCRAFSFRHTTRGRDPYATRYAPTSPFTPTPTRDLPPPSDHTCLLYDTDLMRLPSYNIEPDQDFDLFEMGRLMGAECVLYEQFLNRRPGYYNPGPVTSTVAYPVENREYHNNHHNAYPTDRYDDRYGSSNRNPYGQHGNNNDQQSHGTGHNYLINRESTFTRPPATTMPFDSNRGSSFERPSGSYDRPQTSVFDSSRGPVYGSSGSYNGNNYDSSRGSGGHYDDRRTNSGGYDKFNTNRDYHQRPHVVSSSAQDHVHVPPSTLETGLMIGGQGSSSSVTNSGGSPPTIEQSHVSRPLLDRNTSHEVQRVHSEPPAYDRKRESCIRVFRQDAYLMPEVSRATFPVKTLDECRVECVRSVEVLRFPCRAMAYRHTTHSSSLDQRSGGTCQLSDTDPRDPDLMQARDRYEGAVTFLYDDREPGCMRGGGAIGGSYNHYDDARGRDRYAGSGYVDYYGKNREPYYPAYEPHHHNHHSAGYDRNYVTNRYDDYNRRDHAYAPANYNPHYWDYHNKRYGDTYNNRYAGESTNNREYNEYRPGTGETTVNGERCLRSCRKNRDTSFYYCQISEQGDWDFCCRPDHFCGYSKGLSVPWCYVGTGPSQNIWRSCEVKGKNVFFNPNVAYLHDRLPPTVYSLTNLTTVAALSKDNAIRLFTNESVIQEVGGSEEKKQETILRVSNSTANEEGGKKS